MIYFEQICESKVETKKGKDKEESRRSSFAASRQGSLVPPGSAKSVKSLKSLKSAKSRPVSAASSKIVESMEEARPESSLSKTTTVGSMSMEDDDEMGDV